MPKPRSRTAPNSLSRIVMGFGVPQRWLVCSARRKEIHVGLERRLERFVPVLQVGQDRQRLRVQRVQPRAKHVGDASFVDEHRHLRFANGELAAVLDLHVLHRIAVGQDAVLRFDPLDDIDELFGEKSRRLMRVSSYGARLQEWRPVGAMLRRALQRVNGSHKNTIARI